MAIADKYDRYYTLQVELRSDSIIGSVLTVQLPFTLEFDIERKNFGSANNAHFRIYNLNANSRNSIRYDQYDMGIFREVTLFAGYGNIQPATVFKGNISRAYSVREGVNFVTHIEAYDGGFGFANADSNLPLVKGMPYSAVLLNLMNDLIPYNIFPGAIGTIYDIRPPLVRGNSQAGSTYSLLRELTGNGFYVDNGMSYCLGDSECFLSTMPIIDSSAGLLGTPYLEQTFLMFDILFEPRLVIGQQVFLASLTASDNISNRQYKVVGLKHKGMISAAVCGSAVTTLSCLYSPVGLSLVEPL